MQATIHVFHPLFHCRIVPLNYAAVSVLLVKARSDNDESRRPSYIILMETPIIRSDIVDRAMIMEGEAAYRRIRKEAGIFLPLYDPEVLQRYPDGKIG